MICYSYNYKFFHETIVFSDNCTYASILVQYIVYNIFIIIIYVIDKHSFKTKRRIH